MRRDINQADIDREADDCFETVGKEGEMRRNAQDADWERTLNYAKVHRCPWKTFAIYGLFAATVIGLSWLLWSELGKK